MSVSHRGMINLAAPLARGLVGFWLLSDGGVRNAVNGQSATRVGTTTPSNSQIGRVLSFDGSSGRIALPSLPITAYPYTISGLVRITTTADLFFFSQSVTTDTANFIGIGTFFSGARAYFLQRNAGNELLMTGTSNVADGRWHTVTAVARNSSAYEIWVDGRMEASASPALGNLPLHTVATIGALQRTSVSNYWPGQIAFVGVWNRALSAGEIRQHSADPDMLHTDRKRALRLPQALPSEFIRGGFRYASSPAGTPRYRGGFRKP